MRGVNKMVLEVKSDGRYFDRALLFLKPEQMNTPQHEITDGADRLLRQLSVKKPVQRGKTAAAAIIGSLVGAGAASLLFLLL